MAVVFDIIILLLLFENLEVSVHLHLKLHTYFIILIDRSSPVLTFVHLQTVHINFWANFISKCNKLYLRFSEKY